MDLWLGRDELGQDAAQTERLFAQRRSDPVVARGRGIPLVEGQVDDLEDRSEARDALGPGWDLELDVRLDEGPLGPDDALGDARDRHEKAPRDLLGRQTPEDAKGERNTCVFREDRVAGGEDEAQEIVSDILVDRRVQVHALLSSLDIASDLFVLALERRAASDQVDRAVLGGPHEPGPRPLRHACDGPLLERGDEGVLCELLSRPNVADHAGQPGDEPSRFDPPDRFDRAMRSGGPRLAATWILGRDSLALTYGESSLTRPRTSRPHGSRRSRRRRVPA